jgi:hypothetical protein
MRKGKPRWRPLTSNSSEGRKQFLYNFPQLISLIKFSVHKITILFFKSKSKYEISTQSLPRWRKLKELLDVSSSSFLLFLYARLTRNWLHFEQPSSYSRYIWSSLGTSQVGGQSKFQLLLCPAPPVGSSAKLIVTLHDTTYCRKPDFDSQRLNVY